MEMGHTLEMGKVRWLRSLAVNPQPSPGLVANAEWPPGPAPAGPEHGTSGFIHLSQSLAGFLRSQECWELCSCPWRCLWQAGLGLSFLKCTLLGRRDQKGHGASHRVVHAIRRSNPRLTLCPAPRVLPVPFLCPNATQMSWKCTKCEAGGAQGGTVDTLPALPAVWGFPPPPSH